MTPPKRLTPTTGHPPFVPPIPQVAPRLVATASGGAVRLSRPFRAQPKAQTDRIAQARAKLRNPQASAPRRPDADVGSEPAVPKMRFDVTRQAIAVMHDGLSAQLAAMTDQISDMSRQIHELTTKLGKLGLSQDADVVEKFDASDESDDAPHPTVDIKAMDVQDDES